MSDAITQTAEDELLASVAPEAAAMPDNLTSHASTTAADLPADSRRQIDSMLGQLDKEESRVLMLLFGLDGATPSSPRQTAEALSKTVEQVDQIHRRALSTLRTLPVVGLELSEN